MYARLGPNQRPTIISQTTPQLTAERIEQQIADQQQAWKLLLEEENRASIERLATCKIPGVFEMELTSNAQQALRRRELIN